MESEFIRWLRAKTPVRPCAPLGLADDAALLELTSGGKCVVTSDLLADGTHFELCKCGPSRAGRKALAVNLSDLAAMAARPLAAIVSVAAPRDGGLELLQLVYEGLQHLADEYDTAIAGGDTNSWIGPLVISVTAIGEPLAGGVWRRGGARPDDEILVTGDFGGSLLGKHFDFAPRVREALLLAENYTIHAATDVSDGLALDLSHILTASQCGAEIDTGAVPVSEAARQLAASAGDGGTALERALGDGEDFELIFTASPSEAQRLLRDQPLATPITRIGRCVAEAGLWSVGADGSRRLLEARGFEH